MAILSENDFEELVELLRACERGDTTPAKLRVECHDAAARMRSDNVPFEHIPVDDLLDIARMMRFTSTDEDRLTALGYNFLRYQNNSR